MSKILSLPIQCEYCGKENQKPCVHTPGFKKPITKSFWCDYCDRPQVILVDLSSEEPKIVKRLPADQVLIPRRPDTGITIRPRSGKPKKG